MLICIKHFAMGWLYNSLHRHELWSITSLLTSGLLHSLFETFFPIAGSLSSWLCSRITLSEGFLSHSLNCSTIPTLIPIPSLPFFLHSSSLPHTCHIVFKIWLIDCVLSLNWTPTLACFVLCCNLLPRTVTDTCRAFSKYLQNKRITKN